MPTQDPTPGQVRSKPAFPFDVFAHVSMPGEIGDLIRSLHGMCMAPPYPWGQWMYARVFERRCATLEGDLIELGVGRGGTSLFLGHLARKAGKKVLGLDSFCGLPKPDDLRDNPFFREGDYRSDPTLPSTIERFKESIAQFQLQDVVEPVQGFFEETLPSLDPGRKFCLAHLDSDLFSSVMCSLEHIWDRVVDGGVVILDDFFHHAQGPYRAAYEFFNARKLFPTYHVVFPYSVFLFKRGRYERKHLRSLDGNIYSFEWMKKDKHFVEVIQASLRSSAHNKRAQNNCRIFLDLLRSQQSASSDIYVYWKALEAYWDQICASVDAVRENRPIYEI